MRPPCFARPDGQRLQAGDRYVNAAYGSTLRQLATKGPRALLEPPISTRIIERTQADPLPGTLAQSDFDAYQPRVTEPVCGPYRVYVVCVPPPPSSGAALLQCSPSSIAPISPGGARTIRRPGSCSPRPAG